MSRFEPAYPLKNLVPASYNPRAITPDAISLLQESIRALGPIRAIIARTNNTIVAGHQRSKAMIGLGMEHAPAYVMDGLNESDEVRFNQIHNSADIESADNKIRILKPLQPGWTVVEAKDIQVVTAPARASQVGETLKLLTKFGEWGNAVADTTGRVLAAPIYAYACHILRRPLRLCVVEPEQAPTVLRYFGRTYGEFSYEHLPNQMWAQSLAQMRRLRDTGKGKMIHSRAYENLLIPIATREQRILDFGAGQKDYVFKLQREGYQIHGVEFYLRHPQEMRLDHAQVKRDIEQMCDDIQQHGRYDVVICDSVLNSVTSMTAEHAVLRTLNALCRPGGTIIFSGRSMSTVQRLTESRTSSTGSTREAWFFDKDGFTAMFQRGVWLFQKFHTLAQVKEHARTYIGPQHLISDYREAVKVEFRNTSWGVLGKKSIEIPEDDARNALAFEFNLPLPDGTSYGYGQRVVDAWEIARLVERRQEMLASQTASSGT
jgi:ParB family transcriptional regulator, chromosome partitioning protein